MKIAWLCPYPLDILPESKIQYNRKKSFHPATWIVNLSTAISDQEGIELHIITETPWVEEDFHFTYNKISFHIFRSPYTIPFTDRGLPSWLPIAVWTKYFLSRRRVRSIIKLIQPDIVHAHGTEYQYGYIATQLGVPFVISIQGVIGFLKDILHGQNWKYQEEIEKRTIKQSQHVISRAEFSDIYLKSINPKIVLHRIDDIVNEKYFTMKREPAENLLFVGSVIPTKGIEELIDAIAIVAQEFPTVMLHIVGYTETSYRTYLERKIELLHIESNIKLLGHISLERLFEEYRTANIFVFPSHFETSPNVIMEAMSIGMPIITTNVGGIPDMITNGETGILVEKQSVHQLSEAILKLLIDSTGLKSEIGRHAKAVATRRFKESVVVSKTISLYKEILQETPAYTIERL